NALQTLLPQIRAEIREEFRTKFKKLFFLQFFPRAEQERLKREYHSIRQMNTKTSTEFMQRFSDLLGSSELLLVPRRSRQRTFSGVFASLPLNTSCVCRLRMWLRLPTLLATMRSFMREMMRILSDQTSETDLLRSS
nr:zinc finger, CCHC-type, retrotransposon Gag domain protein [Tanacetum cinerariifolium]